MAALSAPLSQSRLLGYLCPRRTHLDLVELASLTHLLRFGFGFKHLAEGQVGQGR